MNGTDIVFIIIIIIGIYIGYNSGFYKKLNDTIILFTTSYISKLITDYLLNKIIIYLPFFNLFGASEGIKSINILIYYIIIYVLIIVCLTLLINFIEDKIGIKDKILDQIVSMKKIGSILGAIMSISYMALLLFNIILIFGLPIFNKESIFDSKITDYVINNIPVLSNINEKIYESEVYINEKINNDNTIDTYKEINTDIASHLIENELISEEVVKKLESKLDGIKTKNIEKTKENNTNNDSTNNSNNSYSNDNNYDYGEDSYDDSYNEPAPEAEDAPDEDLPTPNYDEIFKDEYYFDEDEEVL